MGLWDLDCRQLTYLSICFRYVEGPRELMSLGNEKLSYSPSLERVRGSRDPYHWRFDMMLSA